MDAAAQAAAREPPGDADQIALLRLTLQELIKQVGELRAQQDETTKFAKEVGTVVQSHHSFLTTIEKERSDFLKAQEAAKSGVPAAPGPGVPATSPGTPTGAATAGDQKAVDFERGMQMLKMGGELLGGSPAAPTAGAIDIQSQLAQLMIEQARSGVNLNNALANAITKRVERSAAGLIEKTIPEFQ